MSVRDSSSRADTLTMKEKGKQANKKFFISGQPWNLLPTMGKGLLLSDN